MSSPSMTPTVAGSAPWVADDALHFVGEMEVVGEGESVGDDGGFESDAGHDCMFFVLSF